MPVQPAHQPVRPGGGALRVARSVAAALGCLTAAALAHRGAGGVVPVDMVLGLTAGAGVVAWLLAARRLTRAQLTGLVVLAQVVVHTAGTGHEMAPGTTTTMVAVHVLATVLTVAVLDRGEALAWRVARHLALRPLTVLHRPALPVLRVASPMTAETAAHDPFRETARPVRGPPVGA